jgi:hypothetical protein
MEGQEQEGGGIRPDPEKGHLPEGEHARVAAHHVPGHPAHGEHEGHDHDVLAEWGGDHQRQDDEQRQHGPAHGQLFAGNIVHSYHPLSPCGLIQTVIKYMAKTMASL